MENKEYIERGAVMDWLKPIYKNAISNNVFSVADIVNDVMRHLADAPAKLDTTNTQ